MHPALLIGLGYLAWQLIESLDEMTEAEQRTLEEGKRAVNANALREARNAARRLIAEYMARKAEARRQRNDRVRKGKASPAEIREYDELIRILKRKIGAVYARKARIEANLANL